MIEFITSLLDAEIDYIGLLSIVLGYIAFMWIAFTVWVFFDAKRKFNSLWKAALLTLFVLPFNIPGFILYLIFRPEHDDFADVAVIDSAGHAHHYGGVQVPLVHFTGDDGEVTMTFGLTLNPNKVTNSSSDMNIDVSWDSDNKNMTVKTLETDIMTKEPKSEKETMTETVSDKAASISDRLKNSISSIAATVSGSISKSSKQLDDEHEETEVEVEEHTEGVTEDENEEKSSDNQSNDSSKKSKKNKRSKRKKK